MLLFFLLHVLLLGNFSSLSGQSVFNFEVEEGKQLSASILFLNKCNKLSTYSVENNNQYLSLKNPTGLLHADKKGIVGFEFLFDAAGLKKDTYSNTIVIKCLSCNFCCLQVGFYPIIKIKIVSATSDFIPTIFPSLMIVSAPPLVTPAMRPTPAPVPTAAPTPIPTRTPTPTRSVEKTPDLTTPTPTRSIEKTPDKVSDLAPTPTITTTPVNDLTPTPSTSPGKTPAETSLSVSPNQTPTPSPTETPVPTPMAITQPTPTPPAETINLGLIFALIVTVLIGSIVAKKLFDKWKYGNNFANLGPLKKAVKAKEKLSNNWMKKRRSKNIHAIGVGKIDGTENYCIQVFVENADGQMLENPPVQLLPVEFRNFPIYIFEMPRAVFLTENYGKAKDPHETIIGGISGANTNLSNEYGTIGYFCSPTILRPIRKFRKEVFLLSNAHVFANLSNPEKTVKDLIQQPSPGENKRHRFIASLENYVPIKFDNDTEDPNFTDAAIAKLLPNVAYKTEIPMIGKITDHIPKERVELRQKCRKFGRTTGYTEGKIFSIHLSIWIKHGVRESFFKEQFLIVPEDASNDFLQGGDSGSLVADHENRALGLIFAGAGSHTNFGLENLPTDIDVQSLFENRGEKVRNYAVANPICQVLKDLNVKLTL